MKFFIYINEDLEPKSLQDKDHPETAIDFAKESEAIALQLVLDQYGVIEKNKLYGPFDVPTARTRDKDDYY